jgi:hypothetical protein
MVDMESKNFITKEGRGQEAGGRRQEAGGMNLFPLCQTGLKPLNLFMKTRKNMYFETRSARNTASLLNPLNLFMGIPSAFCLRPPASLT